MSQYKYNHQEQKASGIQFPAMLTQKNGQRYKMVSAEDIAWNVKMKDGSLINDTDDLLNYISKTSSTTEEIVNKTFTTYRIDCDVTVCYEGDKFEQNPAIRVYKITDGVSTLLSYEDVINNLLIPRTDSTASTCIIKYDEEGQYLNGIAETGIHILSLKREDTVVARLQITVLSRPERVHSTTIYTESQTIPKTPVGGSYEDGVFIAPIGWTTDVMSLNQDNTIWFSTGTVFSNNNTAIWSAPCMYITKEAVQNTDKYYSNGVAVYKAVSTKKLVYEYNEDTFIYEYKLVTNTDPVLPPDNQEGDYEFSTGVITAPSEWEISPQKAVEQYFESIEQLIITNPSLKDYYIKQKYAYKIYVSFNTYTTAYNGSVYFNKDSIGWTTPVEYLNIDDVLENAKATSNSITKEAFDQARKDLNNVSNEINKKLNDTEENIHTINSKIKSLQDSVKDYTQVGAIVDSLKSLYSWNRVDPPVNGNYEYKIINNYSYDVFITLDAYTGKEWYDKYVYLTVEDKYYQYSASSVMLTTELYALKSSVEGNENRISTLEASVNEMTPDKIRLQVSKGFLNNVTWTPIEDSTVDHTIVIEEKPSTDLISYLVDNVTDPIFGDTYKLKFSYTDSDTGLTINKEYSYRCDYPISTGFLNILSDNLSLGVSQNINGNRITSSINLTVGEGGSTITSEASQIILNGDVIAEAIKTKELNINNTTYLSGNGDVKFAQGTDKRGSIFNSDGTGSLAGGLISWENTGDLSVKGKITATSGYIGYISSENPGWQILSIKNVLPAMYSRDPSTNDTIMITPQYIIAGKEPTDEDVTPQNASWMIGRDGSAMFANKNVMFNNDGSGYIGIHNNNTGETKGISITSNGNVSIDGVNVSINASQQTQIISSVQDNLKEDDDFKNQIAGLVVTPDGTQIIGQLNTEDVSIGNGSCFFKGTDVANDQYGYASGTKGSGYLANRNIYWDSAGNVTMNGDIRATSFEAAVSVTNSIWLTSVEKIIRILAGDDQDKQNAVRASLTSAGIDVGDLDFPVMVVRIDDTYYVMNITKISTRTKTILIKQTYRTIYPIVNIPLYYDQEFPDVYYKDPNLTQLRNDSMFSYDTDPTDTRLLSEFFPDLDGTDPRVMTTVTNYQGTWNKYIRRFSGYYTAYHNRRTNTYSNGKLQQSSRPITEMYCIDGTYQVVGRTFDMWDPNSKGLLGVTTFGAHYTKDVYGNHNKLCVYFVDDIRGAGSLFESVEADSYDKWSTDCIIELNSIIRQYTISSNLDELVDRIAECINRHKRGIADDPQASRGALIRRIGNLYMYNLTYYSGWSLRYEGCRIIIGMMDSIYLRV